MLYMVGAYVVIWACSFIFIFTMFRRQSAIQREIEVLKDAVGEDHGRSM